MGVVVQEGHDVPRLRRFFDQPVADVALCLPLARTAKLLQETAQIVQLLERRADRWPRHVGPRLIRFPLCPDGADAEWRDTEQPDERKDEEASHEAILSAFS